MSDQRTNDNLKKVKYMCEQMLELADLGDKYRTDAGCGVVFGTLRDDAYKIQKLVEKELKKHQADINSNSMQGKEKLQ